MSDFMFWSIILCLFAIQMVVFGLLSHRIFKLELQKDLDRSDHKYFHEAIDRLAGLYNAIRSNNERT